MAINDYLCFTASTATTMSLNGVGSPSWSGQYSTDGSNWYTYTLGTSKTITSGNKLYFRGTFSSSPNSSNYLQFSITTGVVAASGNVMSLCSGSNFVNVRTIPYDYCFYCLFKDCQWLTSPPLLPATTLTNYCYCMMFENCPDLNSIVILPAVTLGNYCYYRMFKDCTSLYHSPALPAIELTTYCYAEMFKGCTSLLSIPILSAVTLPSGCYNSMFYECSNIELSSTETSSYYREYRIPDNGIGEEQGYNAITNMFYGTGGTFTGTPNINTTYYLGSNTYIRRSPLYFIFDTSSSSISLNGINSPSWTGQYSLDGNNWLTYTLGTTLSTGITGSAIFFMGTTTDTFSSSKYLKFTMSGQMNAAGSIMSLYDYSNFETSESISIYRGYRLFYNCTNLYSDKSTLQLPATSLGSYCYQSMFWGCTNLTKAPTLPATTLSNYCYSYMFYGCTSLISAPSLSSTTLSTYCYECMFYGCTSITATPTLPATTLSNYCYSGMFMDCTSLTTISTISATTLATRCFENTFTGCTSLVNPPVLSATTLANGCYYGMFSSCTSLTSAPTLPATTLANYCYQYMFSYCASLATAPALPATTLTNYCYYSMFHDCTSLETAPALPATTLKSYCYNDMFKGCTSLKNLSTFSPITLDEHCCDSMFYGCTSLESLPILPATTLSDYCYNYMFKGCTGIKISATKTSEYGVEYRIPSEGTGTVGTDSLYDMFTNTGGTFTGTPTINTTYYLWGTPPAVTSGICFESTSGTSTVTLNSEGSPSVSNIQYSSDGAIWDSYTFGTSISLSGSDKCYFKADITGDFDDSNYVNFVTTGSPQVSGNVNSLYDSENFETLTALVYEYCYAFLFGENENLTIESLTLPATTLSEGCYYGMFNGCTLLTSAPSLPAITLVDYCYYGMFNGCTSLTTPPSILHPTTLSDYCYNSMFYGCTSLTSTPTLPATTLAESCYEEMFKGCTSLTTVSSLPATTLDSDCYRRMFENCTSLTSVPELPATTLAYGCYSHMFKGCTSLTRPLQLPATTLSATCYSNMFSDCTGIKLSATETSEYNIPYRIPSSGTGTSESTSLDNMFTNTGGTFTGTPAINTTYYMIGITVEFDNVELSNAIFDHFNVSSSTTFDYSTTIPTEWDNDTIMDANFNDNLSADKIKLNLSDATSIKIKRREKDTFDWITLFEITINDANDLSFTIQDYYNKAGVDYDYAIVPVMQGEEMGYIISDVYSFFDNVFLCDDESVFKMFADVKYGTTESYQSVGITDSIGKKYPFVISNSLIDYKTGSVSGLLLNSDYEDTRIVERYSIVKREKKVNEFLKNKHAKILKDGNGNIWIIFITGNPTLNYESNYGNGIITLNFNWTEQGDPDSQTDLYNNGLVDISL